MDDALKAACAKFGMKFEFLVKFDLESLALWDGDAFEAEAMELLDEDPIEREEILSERWSNFLGNVRDGLKNRKGVYVLTVVQDENELSSVKFSEDNTTYDESEDVLLLPPSGEQTRQFLIEAKLPRWIEEEEGSVYFGVDLPSMYLTWFSGKHQIFKFKPEDPKNPKCMPTPPGSIQLPFTSHYSEIVGNSHSSFDKLKYSSADLLKSLKDIYEARDTNVPKKDVATIVVYLMEASRFRVLETIGSALFSNRKHPLLPKMELLVKNWSKFSKQLFVEDVKKNKGEGLVMGGSSAVKGGGGSSAVKGGGGSSVEKVVEPEDIYENAICKEMKVVGRSGLNKIIAVAVHVKESETCCSCPPCNKKKSSTSARRSKGL